MKKFIRIIAAAMAAFFCLQIVAFAEGDPNIDNGGGGLKDGSSENFWNPGNDGVRVTIVDAEMGAVKSASIDYTNTNASDIALHFGKVSKAEYVGGTALSATTSSYTFINPTEPLPTIISDGSGASIEEIRSYFTDEQVVKRIAEHTRIEFDDLTNGDYKLMVEPIMYITFNGIRTAMTATEAALYNMQTGGEMINKMGPLSHKNLPLAMFLEKDDLGYTAWTGSKNSYMTDSDIIQYLGVGIVSFKEPEEEVEVAASDYEYRVDTDVYTSITVTGGEHTPDNPVTVRFYIKNKVYTVGNIVYPKGASQLVWCKWHTPNTEQTVNIKVTVTGGASASKTNITANIVDLNKNPPPDPTADDRNDSFRAVSVPNREQRTSAAWSVWSAYWQPKWVWQSRWRWTGKRWVDRGSWVDKGEWKFRSNSYSVSMSANMQITCDEKNPTNVGRTMKSGYGINETVTASISGNGQHTELQNAVAYFPEFYYKTYWRLLEYTNGALEFRKNKYSTYNNRTHFTPLWYPDGNYKVYTWAIDCWTPAGMLSANLTDSLTIKGNVFDDWHIAPSH
jgi:Holliday junction resolvasome RuvABC endonuclease subunit